MKRLPALKSNFLFLKRSLFLLIMLCVLFACHKDNSHTTNSNAFFNYSGKNPLVIKTIGQLKQLNDNKPFADSLNSVGTFKWDAYVKSAIIDSGINNYNIIVPYVDKQNVLAGYITVSVTKTGVDSKPVTCNYETDYVNSKDFVQRHVMGNMLQLFKQKGIALTNNFTAMQAADKKQMTLVYAPNTKQQSIEKPTTLNSVKTLHDAVCVNIYNIEYISRLLMIDPFKVNLSITVFL